FEMSNLTGEGKIARAVKKAAVVPVTTPWQNQSRDFHDLVALRSHRIKHHQLLQHPVCRELLGCKIGESQVADFLAGLWFLEKPEDLRFVKRSEILACLVEVAGLPVAKVRKSFESRRAGRHAFRAEFLQCQGVPGNCKKFVVPFLLPILKRIFEI